MHTVDPNSPVVILCGGPGTRDGEDDERLPKGMVNVGGHPLLWHVMEHYARYGFRRFILCLGDRGWAIKRFFLERRTRLPDVTMLLAEGEHEPRIHDGYVDKDWDVTFVETGREAGTGARLRRVRHYLDTPRFLLTYGDGVADVAIDELVATHVAAGRVGTVAGVHPMSRYGELVIDGDRAARLDARRRLVSGWASGGHFIFERSFLDDYLDAAEDLFLEEGPLRRLARAGQLSIHRHEGPWITMDTHDDRRMLNQR